MRQTRRTLLRLALGGAVTLLIAPAILGDGLYAFGGTDGTTELDDLWSPRMVE